MNKTTTNPIGHIHTENTSMTEHHTFVKKIFMVKEIVNVLSESNCCICGWKSEIIKSNENQEITYTICQECKHHNPDITISDVEEIIELSDHFLSEMIKIDSESEALIKNNPRYIIAGCVKEKIKEKHNNHCDICGDHKYFPEKIELGIKSGVLYIICNKCKNSFFGLTLDQLEMVTKTISEDTGQAEILFETNSFLYKLYRTILRKNNGDRCDICDYISDRNTDLGIKSGILYVICRRCKEEWYSGITVDILSEAIEISNKKNIALPFVIESLYGTYDLKEAKRRSRSQHKDITEGHRRRGHFRP